MQLVVNSTAASAGASRKSKVTSREEQVVVRNLYKIFGNKPDVAMQMLLEGKHKDDVLKQTGQVVGVQDANFTINKGEIFVIMGLSGSGKSTLIRLLNRLIEPTSGKVIIDGQDVASMSKSQLLDTRRKNMSMVFQSFALMPHRTVLANAAFGLEISGVSKSQREARAMEVLEQVGLKAFAEKFPSQLSGGMQQRVGLARALATDPSVLLMDEAFSALDPLRRTEMQDVLINLQREHQRTVIFVSHDLDEALRIGDRICIMEGGRVVQVGTSDDILQSPADEYVRAFFKGVDTTKYMTADQVAQKEQVTIFDRPDELVRGFAAALERMKIYDREFGVVLDQDHHVLGVVSADSLVKCCGSGGKSLHDALLPNIRSVPGETPIDDLIRMSVADRSPIPVVDGDGRYLGAVTRTALLSKLCRGGIQ